MGNAASKYTAYGKLDAELPPVKKMEYDENYLRVDKSLKVFADDKDREQFIYAVIAISTSNGTLDLAGADYRLFYSRRETREDAHMFASIAALKDGVIVAKIEPSVGGKDQREAFLALRKDVEVKLDGVLQTIPSASNPTTAANLPAQEAPSDMPPAYQSSAVDMLSPNANKTEDVDEIENENAPGNFSEALETVRSMVLGPESGPERRGGRSSGCGRRRRT